MNLAYRLADVDGTLCIVCSMPMQNEPTIIDQYWPTTVRTWDLLQTYCDNPAYDRATWPTLLDGFSCKQSYPGEYWIEDTTSHAMRGVYLSLTNGGRTLPIKTEQRPFPRPKSRLPLEYRDGRWWKNTAAGWKQA